MKKVTSSILIGLTCTSILGLSAGVQSVKADSQIPLQQSQMLNDEMQEFKINEDSARGFYNLTANRLVNGQITDKTTKMSITYGIGDNWFYIINSSGQILKEFASHDNGEPINIDIDTPFNPGETYSIVQRVVESGTVTFDKYFSFTVFSNEKIEVPTINKVTSQDTIITGTGVPGGDIHLTIAGETYTATVDTSGTFHIPLNKTYPIDSAITLYQEKDGIKSESISATVVAPDHLGIPKINNVTDKDTKVTGVAEPGATVHLTVNGLNFHTIASANGQFSINIERSYPADTPISIYQELNGLRSETTEIYVQITTDFIIDKIKSNATSITGSGHPNAQLTVRIDDEDFFGTIDGNGKFAIDLHGAAFKVGTDVAITSVSSEGEITKTVKIYPRDPVVGLVYAGDDDIRGTVDPGATVIITVGNEKYQTSADSKGNFRQSVNPNLVVPGALVTVYTTVNGLESDKMTVVVN